MLVTRFLPIKNERGFIRAIIDQRDDAAMKGMGWVEGEANAVELSKTLADEPAPALTRDELKAKLTELGVPFANNTPTEKLAALLAENQ